MKILMIALLLGLGGLAACTIPAIGSGFEAGGGERVVIKKTDENGNVVEPIAKEQQNAIYLLKIDGID